ncbi:UDP-N-acetylglucosamine 1-carboxyvinyltransferase [Streptomyces specialis]|uniref:UDP-N-acetylglucosamine 1-carboxyvinyltransferase n=1 Tax=Streptomyces specialis TaxID=498367 RepID=UPI00073EBB76|nr:UDP-N-acetylglucosamine 1-carboxyvinyltransferase [Streptomyces specialis]
MRAKKLLTADQRTVRIVGGTPLSGAAQVQGSKNVALHLYAATLLLDEPMMLTGAPHILDTGVCADILTRAGTHTTVIGGKFATRPGATRSTVIADELGRRIRTTPVIAGALLARTGQVTFPLPGGDSFCARYIDRHLAAMRAAGADIEIADGRVHARARGAWPRAFMTNVTTKSWGPSLGATVTALLLAARAPSTSTIQGPSIEPEVTVTSGLLQSCGATIEWEGAEAVHVTGSDRLQGGMFAVPPDRLEAATLALAAAITGGAVHLDNFPVEDFPSGLRSVFADAGIRCVPQNAGTRVSAPELPCAVAMSTAPHPGFPTDVQPQLTAFLTQAHGISRLEERIYPRRDTHLSPLRAFGAAVDSTGPVIAVHGASRLTAADVAAEDIRAVTALVIAALAAEGTSTIRGMYHLRRGYGSLLPKLAALGARVTIDQEMP